MKKLALFALVALTAAVGLADYGRSGNAYAVVAPAAITSGAVSTNVVAMPAGLKFGPTFVISSASAVSNGAVVATLFTTNIVAGGWKDLYCVTNTGVSAVSVYNYPGYLDPFFRIDLKALSANANAAAVMLAK